MCSIFNVLDLNSCVLASEIVLVGIDISSL
jgi:hypothetical protein